ncbi:Holliday junction DNA helicase RuvA [Sphingorhabdus lutea]|uniref:Holliday junction branch migration complex subunit RuvA n=1 Tax=Sphingorhabdus lutea TaxID=1913578 RepID=A0A1L3JDY6_9SPHN|nr:Holliday junction branch migration protein RuvA [Sphingorhabdus lutea]APG63358.1 Holliday junction DNA helicase RuvA [Sphingorhabdus lutea]
MIANLKGRVEETSTDNLVIDVNGVGYLVHCSARTLSAIGAVGEFATIHTHMQVSENDQRLIGFATKAERDWYKLLNSVQGVGGKVALAILSALDADELMLAIGSGDSAMVARSNGVGPKLASRIVNELSDKVGAMAGIGGFGGAAGGGAVAASGNIAAGINSHSKDAVQALTGLGFKPAEASQAVSAAIDEVGKDTSLDILVRTALKKAGK